MKLASHFSPSTPASSPSHTLCHTLPTLVLCRAVELNPTVAQLLSFMCLAEAQAVVTCRATAKGSSAGALAGLEAGEERWGDEEASKCDTLLQPGRQDG